MQECRIDIVHKRDRHRELLGHDAALTRTKERITALAEKVDTITAIWRVVSRHLTRMFRLRCVLTRIYVAQVRHATAARTTCTCG